MLSSIVVMVIITIVFSVVPGAVGWIDILMPEKIHIMVLFTFMLSYQSLYH